jgi:hypothetical protein
MSAIDQSQMPRAQPGREVVPKPVVGKKPYPFWLGGMSPLVVLLLVPLYRLFIKYFQAQSRGGERSRTGAERDGKQERVS